jgi:hypothetical protein
MRTRSRAAERFNTPLQAEAPFDAVLSSIAEENDYRSRRRSTSLPRRASGDPNFDDGSDPTGNQHYQSYRPTWKSVDKVLFEKTSTSYIDMLLKDKISNKTKNWFKKWEALKSIMEISDLLTMFKGLRTKPIPTEANPRGYTDGYHVLHKGRTYTIGPDDVNKCIWDFRRLYPLIDAAFDSSAWHLSQVGLQHMQPFVIYNHILIRRVYRDNFQ